MVRDSFGNKILPLLDGESSDDDLLIADNEPAVTGSMVHEYVAADTPHTGVSDLIPYRTGSSSVDNITEVSHAEQQADLHQHQDQAINADDWHSQSDRYQQPFQRTRDLKRRLYKGSHDVDMQSSPLPSISSQIFTPITINHEALSPTPSRRNDTSVQITDHQSPTTRNNSTRYQDTTYSTPSSVSNGDSNVVFNPASAQSQDSNPTRHRQTHTPLLLQTPPPDDPSITLSPKELIKQHVAKRHLPPDHTAENNHKRLKSFTNTMSTLPTRRSSVSDHSDTFSTPRTRPSSIFDSLAATQSPSTPSSNVSASPNSLLIQSTTSNNAALASDKATTPNMTHDTVQASLAPAFHVPENASQLTVQNSTFNQTTEMEASSSKPERKRIKLPPRQRDLLVYIKLRTPLRWREISKFSLFEGRTGKNLSETYCYIKKHQSRTYKGKNVKAEHEVLIVEFTLKKLKERKSLGTRAKAYLRGHDTCESIPKHPDTEIQMPNDADAARQKSQQPRMPKRKTSRQVGVSDRVETGQTTIKNYFGSPSKPVQDPSQPSVDGEGILEAHDTADSSMQIRFNTLALDTGSTASHIPIGAPGGNEIPVWSAQEEPADDTDECAEDCDEGEIEEETDEETDEETFEETDEEENHIKDHEVMNWDSSDEDDDDTYDHTQGWTREDDRTLLDMTRRGYTFEQLASSDYFPGHAIEFLKCRFNIMKMSKRKVPECVDVTFWDENAASRSSDNIDGPFVFPPSE